MAVDLSSYKVANAELSSSTKFDNLVQAVQDALNALPPAQIVGYPSDATKLLFGDGTWRLSPAVLIADIDLTVSQQFAAIPGTHRNLLLRYHGRVSNGGIPVDSVRLRFNADTGANYENNSLIGNNSAATSAWTGGLTYADFGVVAGSTATASRPGFGEATIPAYAGTTFHKMCGGISHAIGTAAAANAWVQFRSALWASTAAITQIDILLGTGTTWAAGSRAQLYGVN